MRRKDPGVMPGAAAAVGVPTADLNSPFSSIMSPALAHSPRCSENTQVLRVTRPWRSQVTSAGSSIGP